MKRFFILDKFNSWYDWRCTLTAKSMPEPVPKENYIAVDGMDGDLDATEALTGEVRYNSRTVSASFMCSEGTYRERETLLRNIAAALHGRKIQIIEPDDPEHYLLGRAKVKEDEKHAEYVKFTIEATCDPWRYAVNESHRSVVLSGGDMSLVIRNAGRKTLCPEIVVTGDVELTYEGATVELTTGAYKVAEIKLRQGSTVIGLSGSGTVDFVYREATL